MSNETTATKKNLATILSVMGYSASILMPTASKLYRTAVFKDLPIDKMITKGEFTAIKTMIAEGQSKYKAEWAKLTWENIDASALTASDKPTASRVAQINTLLDNLKKDLKASTLAVESIELALIAVRKDLGL